MFFSWWVKFILVPEIFLDISSSRLFATRVHRFAAQGTKKFML